MTNFVRQKFQYFFDMSTSNQSLTQIKLYAGGPEVVLRTAPFWAAFKYFKLGRIKLKFVPAATLPVDPTGLSIEAGDNNSDPRDLFNPGLVRITNGDDIIQIPRDMDEYYATLLDKRWYKFNLSRGFQRSASPLFWDVAQLQQDNWPGQVMNEYNYVTDSTFNQTFNSSLNAAQSPTRAAPATVQMEGSSRYGFFQTGRKVKMGWLPTDYLEWEKGAVSGDPASVTLIPKHGVNTPPYIPMVDIILPQAFLTRHWYRVYVEEEILFKDSVAINPVEYATDYYAQPTDRFVGAQLYQTNLIPVNRVQFSRTALSDNAGDTQSGYIHKTGEDSV